MSAAKETVGKSPSNKLGYSQSPSKASAKPNTKQPSKAKPKSEGKGDGKGKAKPRDKTPPPAKKNTPCYKWNLGACDKSEADCSFAHRTVKPEEKADFEKYKASAAAAKAKSKATSPS